MPAARPERLCRPRARESKYLRHHVDGILRLPLARDRDVLNTEPEGRLLHRIEFPIRWGDMDALGHVNNIMYFRYFEQVRLAWYAAIGYGSLSSDPTGLVIVDNHAEYLKPLVYPAHITVAMGGHSPGNSSFTSSYSIAIDDTLYTRGAARIVWVDLERNRATALPDAVRALL